jgi:hypothetical protein
MFALAVALHLALAAPPVAPIGLVPQLDPGPFQGRELLASSVGVLAGDALVIGGAYEALQLFASGAFQPTAANFRTTAYAVGAAALVVPPLTAVLLTRLARADPAYGAVWKAILLAFAGQVVALSAGYLAYPKFWVVLPVQLVAIGVGTSLGLHWGHRPQALMRAPHAARKPAEPPPAARAPICPDPALVTVAAAG